MTPLQENLIRLFCLNVPIAILLLGPKDAVLRHIWAHRHDERSHLKTWHWETLTVMAVMAAVVLLTGNRPIEWIGWAALVLAHGRNSVMIRMSEAQQQAGTGNPHHVECHAWGTRYLWSGECFWACYFVLHRSWAALAGVAVFALFPLWRRWYTSRKKSGHSLLSNLDELGRMQDRLNRDVARSTQAGILAKPECAPQESVVCAPSIPIEEMNSLAYGASIRECEALEGQTFPLHGHHLAQRLAVMVAEAAQQRAKKGGR